MGRVFTRRRMLWALAVLALAAAIGWWARAPLLTRAGALLVAEDPVEPVDLAVSTIDAYLAGVLELADLYHAGVAKRIGLPVRPVSDAELELVRRGGRLTTTRDILAALRVPAEAIVTFELPDGGTTELADAVARWSAANNAQRVMIVAGRNHSRRVGRAARRAMPSGRPRVILHRPALDGFRADGWWQDRTTLRNGLIELQKLLLDVVRHPLG